MVSKLFGSSLFFTIPARTFATTAARNAIRCRCGMNVSEEEVCKRFLERQFRLIAPPSNRCGQMSRSTYFYQKNCALSSVVMRLQQQMLDNFPDVLFQRNPTTHPEALAPIPPGECGNFRGDYGKNIAPFMQRVLPIDTIRSIEAVIDIGGSNTLTVRQVAEVTQKSDLLSIIIDRNGITPALEPESANIKYMIGDAIDLISGSTWGPVERLIEGRKTLFLVNNVLTVLDAKTGWKLLEETWRRMKKGDMLIITGLTPYQLEKYRLYKRFELDGIAEYFDSRGFAKTAFTGDFTKGIEAHLGHDDLEIMEEVRDFPALSETNKEVSVEARRVLVLLKI